MTYTLYYSPGSCSLAPHIVLQELGLPFTLKLVSTSDGATRSPAHLRLNPKGRVPVLTFGEAVLTEAPAILLHLALADPGQTLLPFAPDGLVRCVEWFNWLSGTVHSGAAAVGSACGRAAASPVARNTGMRLLVLAGVTDFNAHHVDQA